MRPLASWFSLLLLASTASIGVASVAHAQPSGYDPLPPLPPSATGTPTPTPTPTPTGTPTGTPNATSDEPIPPPPPPVQYTPAPEPTHAPHDAFWVGARLGLLGYGGSFFVNQLNAEETTGNIVEPGAALEANAGARLNKRYVPYVLFEYAGLRPGHRFDHDAKAESSLLGLGFRFVIGNVDRAGVLADLSVGLRTITVRQNGQEFKMQGPEIFRLGLGAEIRLSKLFTLSPLAHLSGGSMGKSSGDLLYAPNQGDHQTKPTFLDGSISGSQRSYLVVGVGCGAHFDLFGK